MLQRNIANDGSMQTSCLSEGFQRLRFSPVAFAVARVFPNGAGALYPPPQVPPPRNRKQGADSQKQIKRGA